MRIGIPIRARGSTAPRLKVRSPHSVQTRDSIVQPHLQAIRDANGNITDVEISYPLDLAEQMLGYTGRR